MKTLWEGPDHPGNRKMIIPPNMSVKETTERFGIGRSTLSNFLNGKLSLSSEMDFKGNLILRNHTFGKFLEEAEMPRIEIRKIYD